MGDHLYAGGQQVGTAVEIETVKPVSQSYLTSLWSDKAFEKASTDNLNTLTNQYSRRFTLLVILIASSAALFWVFFGEATRGLKAFISVLIVACPCALALAAPFALGTTQRLLARMHVFLKNAFVLERMARADAIVFDKTGTLTARQGRSVAFHAGAQGENGNGLSIVEAGWVCSLAAQSVHPYAQRIREWLGAREYPFLYSDIETPSSPHAHVLGAARASSPSPHAHVLGAARASSPAGSWRVPPRERLAKGETPPLLAGEDARATRIAAYTIQPVQSFLETPGLGISGMVQDHSVRLGSRAWLQRAGVSVPPVVLPPGSASYLGIDGKFRGAFSFSNSPSSETVRMLGNLGQHYQLFLLSGDNEREREHYRQLFDPDAALHFNQTPYDKLEFVRSLQASGKTVMMVGDGLNDAGALKQSDIGIAVVDRVGTFSPASDLILESAQVPRLFEILKLANKTVRIVRWSFGISAAYNLIGVSIAAAGILSPLICAVLMPLSSFSVVLFACGMSNWAARSVGVMKA
jgi:Cu+-exporting ATPase